MQLGDSLNLLCGLRSSWYEASSNSAPYCHPSNNAVATSAPEYTPLTKPETQVKISKHETAESLLSAIYPYVITPDTSHEDPRIGAGPLLLSKRSRIKELETTLGISLSDINLRYVLVQRITTVGISQLRKVTVSHEFRVDASSLPEGRNSSAKDVEQMIRFIERRGSHFVNAIDFGDIIFQVFVYSTQIFDSIIANAWQDADYCPSDFQAYTTPEVRSSSGTALTIGNVCSLANDIRFAQSVAAGEWMDNIYAKTNSIFAPNNPAPNTVYKPSDRAAPIKISLTSISSLLNLSQVPLFQLTMKGMMITQFGAHNVTITKVASVLPTEYSETFSTPSPLVPISSLTVTPQISLFKEILNLPEYFDGTVAWDRSESIFLLANVLQVSGRVTIPSQQCVLIAGLLHGIEDPTSKTSVAEIIVSETAFDDGHFYFLDSIGCIQISTPTGRRRTITSGNLEFVSSSKLDQCAIVTCRQTNKIPASLLDSKVPASSLNSGADRLALLFDLSLTAASLNLHKPTFALNIMMDYLRFIGVLIPHDTTHTSLISTRTSALALRSGLYPSYVVFPLIMQESYEQYKDTVADTKKCAELIKHNLQAAQIQIEIYKAEVESAKPTEPKEAIKRSAEILSEHLNVVNAAHLDFSGHYKKLLEKIKDVFKAVDSNVQRLEGLLVGSREFLIKSIQEIKAGWSEWTTNLEVAWSFQVIASIFSLDSSGETTQTDVDPRIVSIFTKLQRLVRVIAMLIRTISKDGEIMETLGEAPILLNNSLADLPSIDEFGELATFLGGIFDQQLVSIPALSRWASEVQILMNTGATWASTIVERETLRIKIHKSVQQETTGDLLRQKLRQVNENSGDITNDIDLIGISNHFQFILHSTCERLANVLTLQNAALEYEYLIKPLPISKIELGSLLQLSADIEQSVFDVPPLTPQPLDPVVLEFPILESQLRLGTAKNIDIPINQPQFFRYAMVRVEDISFSIEGIKSSRSGKYEVQVTFTGDSFCDRHLDRSVRTFKTAPRSFSYIYDITSESLIGGGYGNTEGFIKLTPFETWSVVIPKNDINEEIKFDDEVTIIMEIKASGVLACPHDANPCLATSAVSCVTKSSLRRAAPEMNAARSLYGAPSLFAAPAVSKNDVLWQLSLSSIMKGWDCVLCMDLRKVNTILERQHKSGSGNNIPRTLQATSNVNEADAAEPDVTLQIKMDANFYIGPARTVFLNEADKIKLEMDIYLTDPTNSSRKSQYTRTVTGPPEYTRPSRTYDVLPNTKFTAIVPIQAVTGSTSGTLDVWLQLAFASEAKYEFTENGRPASSKVLADAVKDMFRQKGFKYLFIKIDQRALATIPELVPNFLRFSMYQSYSRPVLVTYIKTTSPTPQKPEFNISYPLPDSLDIDCCLFISNKITVRSILAPGFQKSKEWAPLITQASGETDFDTLRFTMFSTLSVPFPAVSNVSVPNNRLDVPVGSFKLFYFELERLTIAPSRGSYNMNCKLDVTYNQEYFWKGSSQGTTEVTIRFNNTPITIDVRYLSSSNLKLKYNIDPSSMHVDSHIKIDKDCCGSESNDQASAQLNANLRRYFPEEMARAMNSIEFDSVSVLVLKGLLFPSSNMRLNNANNPGDIVLWGDLN